MEPDPSDLSREELKQRIAELEAEKKSLQHQRDKAVAGQDEATQAVTPGPDVGGVAGIGAFGATVRDATFSGSVDGSAQVGGLVGKIGGSGDTVRDSTASAVVTGKRRVGGLVGENNNGTIRNSSASGVVNGSDVDVGGLVGISYRKAVVRNSTASSAVDGPEAVGGFIGRVADNSTISGSQASGSVNGSIFVGGFAGSAGDNSTIKDSVASGNVTGSNDVIGGFAGDIGGTSTLRNVTATGTVESTDPFVGGLVGLASDNAVVRNSETSADVSGGNSTGGAIGLLTNNATLERVTASGSVTGGFETGGLVGDTDFRGTIQNSAAFGDVNGSTRVGGLVGGMDGDADTAQAVAAYGSVDGSEDVGGLVGYNGRDSTIRDAFAVGLVTGAIDVGGLTGRNFGTIEDAYWEEQATGQSTSDGSAVNLTTAEMQGQAARTNMSGLDFENTWTTTSGYPELRERSEVAEPAPGEGGGGNVTAGRPTYDGNAVHYVTRSNSGTPVVEIPFDGNVDTASITRENFTLLDGGDNTSAINEFSRRNATVVLELDRVYSSDELRVSLSENITDGNGNPITNPGTKSVVFAGQTLEFEADADGGGQAVQSNRSSDINAYQGVKLAINASKFGTTGGEIPVTIEGEDNNYFQEGSTGTNSSVYIFNTENRELGEYRIFVNGSDDPDNRAFVTIRDLGLNVTVDNPTVTEGDTIETTVSAVAGGRAIEAELIDSDGNVVNTTDSELDGQGLAGINFDTSTADRGDPLVPGTYTVEITDSFTGTSTESTEINVTSDDAAAPVIAAPQNTTYDPTAPFTIGTDHSASGVISSSDVAIRLVNVTADNNTVVAVNDSDFVPVEGSVNTTIPPGTLSGNVTIQTQLYNNSSKDAVDERVEESHVRTAQDRYDSDRKLRHIGGLSTQKKLCIFAVAATDHYSNASVDWIPAGPSYSLYQFVCDTLGADSYGRETFVNHVTEQATYGILEFDRRGRGRGKGIHMHFDLAEDPESIMERILEDDRFANLEQEEEMMRSIAKSKMNGFLN